MTSGVFQTCAIDRIIINREDRQRRDLGDIQSLADSIKRHGVMHPPVITRDYILVAGERRLTAMRDILGWDTTPFQFVDQVSQSDLRRIELEENTKREDLSWPDQVRGIEAIHKLEVAEDPKWTLEKTAASVGFAYSYVHKLMQVAKSLDDPDIAQQPNIAGAVRKMEVKAVYAAAAEASDLMSHGYGSYHNDKNQPVLYTRFEDWLSSYDGPRFNLVHCDFPYGIGFNRMGTQAGSTYGRYSDSLLDNRVLLQLFCTNLDIFAEDSCHFVFWFSMQNYQITYDILTDTGIILDPFPFIWLKSDNTGIVPDALRGPRRVYETAFFGRRGDRPILSPRANALAYPSNGETHPHEKPQAMLEHFFSMFVNEHTTLFDPTCGSGSALRAARSLGAQRVLGLEADERFAQMANFSLSRSQG
jgi:ParB family chromosome partitioning protein